MNEEDYLTSGELNCLKFLEQKDESHHLQKTSTLHEPTKEKQQQTFDLLFDLHPHPQLQQAKRRLDALRRESDKLSFLQSNLSQYKDNFQHLIDSKISLEDSIKIIQGDSGHILQKQNKMVALSLELQQILDRYNYISKFKFDDVVERFNDAGNLQLILSQLTDGIQFFASHPNFSNSKKYLQKYRDQKKKTLGFIRGHLLKIFTKQDTFVMKQSKSVHLEKYFDNSYPKATFKFLTDYLTIFPQFKFQLNDLYSSAKQSQQNISQLSTKKDQETQQFILDHSVKSLIRFIEINEPQLHSQALLKLFSFYRINLHQQLISQYSSQKQPLENILVFLQYLAYIIPSQITYITYCLGLNRIANIDSAKVIVMNIVNSYTHLIKPSLKQIKSWRQIFQTFKKLNEIMQSSTQIIDNYAYKMQYKVYPLGKIMNLMVVKTDIITDIMKGVYEEIFSFLEQSLDFYLPKDWKIQTVACPEPSIQELINIIPNLKYCPKLCNKYIVQSIDSVLRAISNINSKLQTRYEAFLWNITSINGLQVALASARLTKPLLKTQMSLNLGGTVSVIDSVSKIQNKGNIWNYAKQVFSVLSTGLPVLNELTVDFNEYLKSHLQKLQTQFSKDLTFIYGKSMIQFLQKLHNHQQQQSKTLLSVDSLKQQYQRLILGLDEFVTQSIKQFQQYKKGYIIESVEHGPKLLVILMQQVLQNLLELLSEFYIATSKTVDVAMVKELEFNDIKDVKDKIVQKLKNK